MLFASSHTHAVPTYCLALVSGEPDCTIHFPQPRRLGVTGQRPEVNYRKGIIHINNGPSFVSTRSPNSTIASLNFLVLPPFLIKSPCLTFTIFKNALISSKSNGFRKNIGLCSEKESGLLILKYPRK